MLAEQLDNLPNRLRQNLAKVADNFVAGIRTEYRENPDLPFCWLVVTGKHVAIASTHRRAIHDQYDLNEINQLRIHLSDKTISVLPTDPDRGDRVLPVPKATDIELHRFFELVQTAIKNSTLV